MRVRTRPPRGTSRPPRGPHAHSPHSRDDPNSTVLPETAGEARQNALPRAASPSRVVFALFSCCQLDPAHILESFLAKLRARRRFEERRYLPGFSRIFPDFRRVRFYWGQGYMPMSDVQKSRVFAKNSFFAQNGHRTPQVERVFAGRVFGPPNAHGPCAYVRWAVIWRVRKKPSHMSHAQHGD